jgi:tRNA-modifying protein YgfZ
MATHFALAETAVVRVTGEDAAAFLQGQCTADLRGVTSADALWLNRKGRVLAHTVVVKESDGSFLLLAPHSTAEALMAVVTANVIADDLTATDESASWRRWVAWGELPLVAAARVFATKRYGVPAWDVLTSTSSGAPGEVVDLAVLESLRIQSGVPSVPADCGANEFPQECGLEPWVSYTKGCYLGQEVMARIQSMGSLRRILRRVASTDGTPLVAGSELSVAGKVVGKVRSVAGPLGLALVNLDLSVGTVGGAVSGGVVLGAPATLPLAQA